MHTWWPDAPGTVARCGSPTRPAGSTLRTSTASGRLTAAFVLDLDDGTRGIVAVDCKYHERMKPEIPKPRNLSRNLQVARRSGVFKPRAIELAQTRSELAVIWLEHLLMLSMLQHPSGQWTWARYAVVHPAGNGDFVDACARYRDLLVDRSTFAATTLEDLLAVGSAPETDDRRASCALPPALTRGTSRPGTRAVRET